jgi:hypothetical protein
MYFFFLKRVIFHESEFSSGDSGEPNFSEQTNFSFLCLNPSLENHIPIQYVVGFVEVTGDLNTTGTSSSDLFDVGTNSSDRKIVHVVQQTSDFDRTNSAHVPEQNSGSQVRAGIDTSSCGNEEASSSVKFWINMESEDEEVIQSSLELGSTGVYQG